MKQAHTPSLLRPKNNLWPTYGHKQLFQLLCSAFLFCSISLLASDKLVYLVKPIYQVLPHNFSMTCSANSAQFNAEMCIKLNGKMIGNVLVEIP